MLQSCNLYKLPSLQKQGVSNNLDFGHAFRPFDLFDPPSGPQEEKVKDTVLINGIGFVAACVPWTLMIHFCVWQQFLEDLVGCVGCGCKNRIVQVDSEILRIHAMKDRTLLAALQVTLVANR